jgi:8-oxo-dGTP pyrophosphatase MutT (NUDIX family)
MSVSQVSGNFIRLLRNRFQQALPGEAAQNPMSWRTRMKLDYYLRENPNYKTSAVLLLLYPIDELWHTLLIERPGNQGVHSGQLALPGGAVEANDESLMHTALREAEEEVGLPRKHSEVLGQLTPLYIPPSNFLVQPFVALLPERFNWIPNISEAQTLLEVPLLHFLDPNIKDRRRIPIGKNLFVDAPCYMIGERPLWGATAMVFSELEVMVREVMNKK